MFIACFEAIIKQQSVDFVGQHFINDWYTLKVLKFIVEMLYSIIEQVFRAS